jgi:hypothetical protein
MLFESGSVWMKRDIAHTLLPRGLSREEAAEYIGVSASLFDRLVEDGRMPRPKAINSRVVWDRQRLDVAFDVLPDRGEPNPWDAGERES